MVFTEAAFVPFLIITYLLFYSLKSSLRGQIWALLLTSIFFYGWWNLKFVGLILFSAGLDYAMAGLIEKSQNQRLRKLYLTTALVGNLGLLFYFKYVNFFIESFQTFAQSLGFSPSIHTLNIILPVGISFYTFHTLSYTIEVYMGRMKTVSSFAKYSLFVMIFPPLVAGPIVRANHFLDQLNSNLYDKSRYAGIFLIFYGVIKKVFFADPLGYYVVDKVFAAPGDFSSLELMFGIYCYALQIFFDFSGYSDIAIGLGRMFGLELPTNFKAPYLARNPSDFWQRWHISLSSWLRDYLYLPLGGNRVSKLLNVRNLMLVMMLGGLWHGSNWTFFIWGTLHGIYLVTYKYLPMPRWVSRTPALLQIFLFFNLVCLTWIFFRAPNFHIAREYLTGISQLTLSFTHFDSLAIALLLGGLVLHYGIEPILQKVERAFDYVSPYAHAVFFFILFLGLVLLDESGANHVAFIYFQF